VILLATTLTRSELLLLIGTERQARCVTGRTRWGKSRYDATWHGWSDAAGQGRLGVARRSVGVARPDTARQARPESQGLPRRDQSQHGGTRRVMSCPVVARCGMAGKASRGRAIPVTAQLGWTRLCGARQGTAGPGTAGAARRGNAWIWRDQSWQD
jgi:hypothetical protein